jgi:hypothetical protein
MMYVFVMDHEQGRVFRHELPDDLQGVGTTSDVHDARMEWLSETYDMPSVDVMFTDQKKIMKIKNPFVVPCLEEGLRPTSYRSPIPREVIYKGQRIFMSGPPTDSEEVGDD